MKRSTGIITLFVLTVLVAAGVSWRDEPAQAADEVTATKPALLSAYFGLDNALPRTINLKCRGGGRDDGMPVVFSSMVNESTLQAEDFAVMTASGTRFTPRCATLEPATDTGETRTALLIGEFGSADDVPVRVEIVGEILADTANAASFAGLSVAVTPLEAGPFISAAEAVPESQRGGCPNSTLQAVRVIWAGGVTGPDGAEVNEVERLQYIVILLDSENQPAAVTPAALSDLDDGDNNHILCLDAAGTPVSVAFPAGYLMNPNHDTLNPATSTVVTDAAGSTQAQPVHNVRYCEILPLHRQGLKLVASVYNTLGLNDCPAAEWDALDAETLKASLGAVAVNLNGPRYFLMDEIIGRESTASGEAATFGTIDMTKRAELALPLNAAETVPYAEREIHRETIYVFFAGTTVFELTAPDGAVYVMQSYAQIVDPSLTLADLATLGERLALPEGWSYAPRVLDSTLIVAADGLAYVVQDDFANTYQRADG